MESYKEMYYQLFNAITDSIGHLMKCESIEAINTSMGAQQKAEELYIESES